MTAKTFDDIREVIEQNGTVSEKTRSQLILVGMSAIWEKLNEIEVKVDAAHQKAAAAEQRHTEVVQRLHALEKIVLWPVNHPTMTGLIVAVALILANLWFISDFRKGFLNMLNLPTELFPTAIVEEAPHIHLTPTP